MKKNKPLYRFIDIKKPFDSLNRQVIWDSLEKNILSKDIQYIQRNICAQIKSELNNSIHS